MGSGAADGAATVPESAVLAEAVTLMARMLASSTHGTAIALQLQVRPCSRGLHAFGVFKIVSTPSKMHACKAA